MQQDSYKTSWHKVNWEKDGMSQEHLKFMQALDNGTRRNDGHYEMPILIRDDNVRFLNNKL